MLLTCLLAFVVAHPPELDADPDAAATGVAWRAGIRAVLAANLPLAEPRVGFVLRVPGLVELNNETSGQGVPWESWRARVSLMSGWRFGSWLTLLGAAEHESDHGSDGGWYSGYVNLNSVALRAESQLALGRSDRVFVVANNDVHWLQLGWVQMPIWELGIPADEPYVVEDLLDGARYTWHGEWNYVKLDPDVRVAHILVVRP